MHANLNPCFGFCKSPINSGTPGASTFVFYANASIQSLSSTAAIGDAPTSVLTNVPNGGWMIGVRRLPRGGWRPGIFLVLPKVSSATSVIGSTAITEIKQINLEGEDPLPLPDCPLATIAIAFAWSDGIFMADDRTAYYYDGETYELLNWSKNLIGGPTIRGAWPIEEDLRIIYRQNVSFSYNTEGGVSYASIAAGQMLHYNSRLKTFGPCAANTLDLAVFSAGPQPFNASTRYAFFTGGTTSWTSQYVLRPGVDAYSDRDVLSGASDSGHTKQTSGVVAAPSLDLPWPLTGSPFHIDAIGFGGIVDTITAASDGSVTITAPTFPNNPPYKASYTDLWQWHDNPDKISLAHKFSWVETLTQEASNTSTTPQGVPFMFGGRVKITQRQLDALPREMRAR